MSHFTKLLTNLKAAGHEPSQVDEVYISHVGPDHVGGLTIGAERAYPNAIVRAAMSEVGIFVDPVETAAAIASAPDKPKAKEWFDFQRALYQPYIDAGKFQTFDADATLSPGIRSMATHGRTVARSHAGSYVMRCREQRQEVNRHWRSRASAGISVFAHPSAYTAFDADPKAASAERLRVFRMAAEQDDWVAGAHLSFPGVGHIRESKGQYFWIPAIYTLPQ